MEDFDSFFALRLYFLYFLYINHVRFVEKNGSFSMKVRCLTISIHLGGLGNGKFYCIVCG